MIDIIPIIFYLFLISSIINLCLATILTWSYSIVGTIDCFINLLQEEPIWIVYVLSSMAFYYFSLDPLFLLEIQTINLLFRYD